MLGPTDAYRGRILGPMSTEYGSHSHTAEISYSVRDLVALASAAEGLPLSERVARQYIAEGLLPPAHAKGGPKPYGEEHLLQLRLVLRLATQYVPLREIQRFVDRLPAEGVRALVDRPLPARSPSEGDAHAYLTRLSRGLRPSLALQALFRGENPTPSRSTTATPRPRGLPNPKQPPTVVAPAGGLERSTWMRLVVDKDVELHLRTGEDSAHQRLVDALVAAVQEVLETERGVGL
jgi:DNA-binding transcriptional MerR regulator